jgi:hypothetical protein
MRQPERELARHPRAAGAHSRPACAPPSVDPDAAYASEKTDQLADGSVECGALMPNEAYAGERAHARSRLRGRERAARGFAPRYRRVVVAMEKTENGCECASGSRSAAGEVANGLKHGKHRPSRNMIMRRLYKPWLIAFNAKKASDTHDSGVCISRL